MFIKTGGRSLVFSQILHGLITCWPFSNTGIEVGGDGG